MKEHPILFSGPMVRAILEGRKTMTRRVVKGVTSTEWWLYGKPSNKEDGQATIRLGDGSGWTPGALATKCPYGQPGDRLWVRETWGCTIKHVGESSQCGVYFSADSGFKDLSHDVPRKWLELWDSYCTCRRPSIHMPRWASRITLEIVSVRVERLQDISEENAKAEGIDPLWGDDGKGRRIVAWRDYASDDPESAWIDPRRSFRSLWDSINLARGYGWESNPWVWVVEFKRVP